MTPDPNALQQLRALLDHLEKSPANDPTTAELLRRFVHTRIRALEIAKELATQPECESEQ